MQWVWMPSWTISNTNTYMQNLEIMISLEISISFVYKHELSLSLNILFCRNQRNADILCAVI